MLHRFFTHARLLPCLKMALAGLLTGCLAATSVAQNINNGHALYNKVFIPGTKSCADGGCHGPDPMRNQNKVRKGTTVAALLKSFEKVGVMRFLQGQMNNTELADLAAYIANPAAVSQSINITPTTVTFNTVWQGTVTAPVRITVTNAASSPLTLTGITTSDGAFRVSGGSCGAGVALAPGSSCNIELRFDASTSGGRMANLFVQHDQAGSPASIALTGAAQPLPLNTKLMVEYREKNFDYYFITSKPEEQAMLDSLPTFERTGESFPVRDTAAEGYSGLSRFYFDKIAKGEKRGSHFYTALEFEKSDLRGLNPTNQRAPMLPFDEGIDSYVMLADPATGACGPGLQPVWRLFRGQTRFPDDPNHRFVVRQDLYDQFVALGWDGEGIRFCVPIE